MTIPWGSRGVLLVASALFVAVVLFVARVDGGRSSSTLVVTGSSTVAPLATEIALRYEQRDPGSRVDVQAGGSSRGIADTRSGLGDVGMVSRALGPAETDMVAFPIARDGVALIVHATNAIAELTSEQVRGIWSGEIGDWRDVGGRPGPITVVHKAEGRATLEVFLEYFSLTNRQIEADVIVGGNQQAILTVEGNPGAVGYVSIGEAELEAVRGVPIRLLPLEGVPPTTDQVAAGRFPLTRVLNLVTAGPPSEAARRFIDFSRSPEVHDLVREAGFVPVADS